MLHTLFLQDSTHISTVEVTSLTNVYLALGGTLVAAIIAAWASWNAAKTAERAANLAATTAQKVADLSRQTTKEVADLSAQVSRESAGLASQTAKEIKETDYKHDFYKRIIAKRLAAWEEAEKFIPIIASTLANTNNGLLMPACCINSAEFDKILKQVSSMIIGQVYWMGSSYAIKFNNLYTELTLIREEAALEEVDDVITELDNNLLHRAGEKHYSKFDEITLDLSKMLGTELINLHDVEGFFADVKTIVIASVTTRKDK